MGGDRASGQVVTGDQPEFHLPFIGLTGAVAAGKSVALAQLEELGAATLSADAATHDVLCDPEVIELIRERLGDGAVNDEGVNRDAVARLVFGDDDARKWLEQIIWPRVGARIWQWRQENEHLTPAPRALVVEVPLLFEAGMDAAFDTTIVIATEQQLRRQRAAARGHENVDEREARQLSQDEKAERADHVITNDGSIEHLNAKLEVLLTELQM
ncbi:MAG: dephospho-CoA kinase [Thermoleophilaceae bacterium]|nr:dephospho-CoA kinase [Thermoleophilaceae bacterium]